MNWWQLHGDQVVSALVFSLIGMAAFALFFLILPRVLPFSLKKEIEEDQNVALGVVIAAVVLGMAFIIGQSVG
jgi:putative membrane protein